MGKSEAQKTVYLIVSSKYKVVHGKERTNETHMTFHIWWSDEHLRLKFSQCACVLESCRSTAQSHQCDTSHMR